MLNLIFTSAHVTAGLALATLLRIDALAQAPPPCVPKPPGLIHWWEGDSANDSVGTAHGSLESGVTAGNPGKVDGAFQFNGVSSGVNLGNVPDLDFAADSSFSFEAWFKSNSALGRIATAPVSFTPPAVRRCSRTHSEFTASASLGS